MHLFDSCKPVGMGVSVSCLLPARAFVYGVCYYYNDYYFYFYYYYYYFTVKGISSSFVLHELYTYAGELIRIFN